MKQVPASRKINETARAVFAQLLLTEVSDPRLMLVTATNVEVSRDRSVADIYVSAAPERYDEVTAGLESAKGRLRSLLGHALGWRVTPELRFHIDAGIDHALAITEALKHAPETHATEEALRSEAQAQAQAQAPAHEGEREAAISENAPRDDAACEARPSRESETL